MKRLFLLTTLLLVLLVLVFAAAAGQAQAGPAKGCATIKDGLLDSSGNPLSMGYDQWGYNYQAHMFNGLYGNFSRPVPPVTSGDSLQMKWNDAWLSNNDCDGDGKLDRHFGFPSYKASGAWLTNHASGTYESGGVTYKWFDFVKIVAVPADAAMNGSDWYSADGVKIGPAIWGEFAIIQEIYNDSGTGDHGVFSKSPFGPGLGIYKP